MEDDFPPLWPPPWRPLLAGAFWIASLDAVAQREWELAGLTLSLSVLTAGWRRLVKPGDSSSPAPDPAPRLPVTGRRPRRIQPRR